MKISVVINNYNYSQYLQDCVESVLGQTRKPDEIIIVDDGSTDDSLKIIRDLASKHDLVRLISTSNQGQLAALLTGCETAKGDVISFLDSDDCYLPAHLSEVEVVFSNYPKLGMAFCPAQKLGEEDGILSCTHIRGYWPVSTIYTYLTGAYIGNATSCLSFSKSALIQMIPLLKKFISEWRINADICFTLGVSLSGFSKFGTDTPTVLYRVHQNNSFHNKEKDPLFLYDYWLNRERFLNRYSRDVGITDRSVRFIYREYWSIGRKDLALYTLYKAALYSRRFNLGFFQRFKFREKLKALYLEKNTFYCKYKKVISEFNAL